MSQMNFNLLEQGWIPCFFRGSTTPELLGIRAVLSKAHEISEISDSSPLVTIAIHRLLLAILHCSIPVIDEGDGLEQWIGIWNNGNGVLPQHLVRAYLQNQDGRFDLFHPEFPFCQCAGLAMDASKSVRVLTVEIENQPSHFDHLVNTNYSPAYAARALLGAQAFSSGSLLRQTARINGTEVWWQRVESAPLYNRAVVWMSGASLFQTLMLNWLPQPLVDGDAPSWTEKPDMLRDIPTAVPRPRHPARGILDRLTWQSRLILLLPEEQEEGCITVRQCYLTHGRNTDSRRGDPMLAYVVSKKKGEYPLSMSLEKASWRNAQAMLLNVDGVSIPPPVVSFAQELAQNGDIGTNDVLQLNVGGVSGESSRVSLHLWRHDRAHLPAVLLGNKRTLGRLMLMIDEAESVARQILTTSRPKSKANGSGRVWQLCEQFLAPGNDSKYILALAKSLDPRSLYWANLEQNFYVLLEHLADETKLETATNEWRDAVESEARQAFRSAANSLGDSARAIRAVASVSDFFTVPSRALAEKENL